MKVLSYNLEGYDTSLLGLDIPVNLTYMLSEKKNDLFISAGISSGTFLTNPTPITTAVMAQAMLSLPTQTDR